MNTKWLSAMVVLFAGVGLTDLARGEDGDSGDDLESSEVQPAPAGHGKAHHGKAGNAKAPHGVDSYRALYPPPLRLFDNYDGLYHKRNVLRRSHAMQAVQYGRAMQQPWHCPYYSPEWGAPVALVVPPTAEKAYEMGWGVGNTRLHRLYYQFDRPYPGVMAGEGGPLMPTPQWPSDTTQFGFYYVRGPW